jgi:long-subunit fatty acid transport protein
LYLWVILAEKSPVKSYLIPLFSLQLIPCLLCAQIWSRPFGMQNALIGNISSCYPANFASLNNPALLSLKPNKQLAIAHQLPYLQSNLAIAAASFQNTTKHTSWGISFIQSGNEFFKQQIISTGFSRKISKNLILGAALNYLATKQLQLKNLHNLYGTLGFIVQINKQLLISSHLINVTASAYQLEKKQDLGQIFQVGIAYEFSKHIRLLSEIQTSNKSSIELRFGLLYHINPLLDIRIGTSKNLNNYSGGILVRKSTINFIMGMQVNRLLGMSPGAEFNQSF